MRSAAGTAFDEREARRVAAMLVREWAERRMVSGYASPGGGGARSGGIDSVSIDREQRALFERCADDIERGHR